MTVAPRTLGPAPDTGTSGVGVGNWQLQLVCCVQEGFRQKPPLQTSPDRQLVSPVQLALQPCRGVGVGVGVCVPVGVGVGVGVGLGVPVGVGVGVRVGVGVFGGVGVGVLGGVVVGVGVGVGVWMTPHPLQLDTTDPPQPFCWLQSYWATEQGGILVVILQSKLSSWSSPRPRVLLTVVHEPVFKHIAELPHAAMAPTSCLDRSGSLATALHSSALVN